MRIQRFEDIIAWQKARVLTQEVYTRTRAGGFARDFGLRDQIQRASVSVMSNIAEGYERDGDREFVQFLSNAKGSCGEVRSDLYVALDQKYIDQQTFDTLSGQASELGRLLSKFITYLRQSTYRGRKFRDEP